MNHVTEIWYTLSIGWAPKRQEKRKKNIKIGSRPTVAPPRYLVAFEIHIFVNQGTSSVHH